MEKKKQHYVPLAYLKGWRDPSTEEGAYLWTVSKTGRVLSRKSPKNLCTEIDIYTQWDKDGLRNIETENILEKIESRFFEVKYKKIEQRQRLDDKNMIDICYF